MGTADVHEMVSAEAAPQLFFHITNSGAVATGETDVLYITADADYNKVKLAIALTAGTTTLSPAAEIPDPDGDPPSTGTVLYLDLSALNLSADVFAGLVLSGGWRFKLFSAGIVGLTPTEAIELSPGAGGGATVDIAKLTITKAPTVQPRTADEASAAAAPVAPTVALYVQFSGVPNVSGEFSTFQVSIRNRPDDHSANLADVVSVLITPATVVNSVLPLRKASNSFALQFSHRGGAIPQAGENTQFKFSVVYGKPGDTYGYGALTDVADGLQIKAARGTNADGWVITFQSSAQSPWWNLQPPADAPIVSAGEVVEIKFSDLLTTYQPGPTAILVSYENVPGYADGAFSVVINKVAHAVVNSMSATPNPTYFRGGSAKVTVSWSVDSATALELTQNFESRSVTGDKKTDATLDAETTVFSLKATGATGGNVDNTDYGSVTATALPVVNSFAGSPTEIYAGSSSHDARLDWAVDTPSGSGAVLSSSDGSFKGRRVDATGTTTEPVAQPQMFTLRPDATPPDLTLTRNLVISAFTLSPQTLPLPAPCADVAASPAGPFVAFTSPTTNEVVAADTVRYSVLDKVSVGASPGAIEFSDDGSLIAVCNRGDKTVAVLKVGLQAGLPTFSPMITVGVPGTPEALAFSPGAKRIFVTVDAGATSPGQLVSLVRSGDAYTTEGGQVFVGKAPRGLSVYPSGSRIFVANSADDTVSVVALDRKGAPDKVTDTIQKVDGGPTGVAVTPDGRQLLVTCPLTDTVVVIDPDHPNTGGRNQLAVEKAPGSIAVTPSGAYAFTANTANGSLSLLSSWGPPSQAAVLKSVPVGGHPAGVAVSPDGLNALVADSAAGSFSLVVLETYRASPTQPSIPLEPTSVAAAPAGGSLFAWHDAKVSGGHPGIIVFDVGSGSETTILGDAEVIQCVFSPDPAAKQAVAIAARDASLHLIDTETLAATQLALPATVPPTFPWAIAVTGDGKTLAVIVADSTAKLTLQVLSLAKGTWSVIQTLGLPAATRFSRILLASTPDGSSLFLVDTLGSAVRVLTRKPDGKTYALSDKTVATDVGPEDIAILPDGCTAFVLNAGQTTNTITVIDIHDLTSHVVAIPQTFVNLKGLIAAPDGRRLYATDTNAGALRVLDPSSLRILQTIPLGATSSGPRDLAIVPDASRIFTANATGQTVAIVEQVQMGGATSEERT